MHSIPRPQSARMRKRTIPRQSDNIIQTAPALVPKAQNAKPIRQCRKLRNPDLLFSKCRISAGSDYQKKNELFVI